MKFASTLWCAVVINFTFGSHGSPIENGEAGNHLLAPRSPDPMKRARGSQSPDIFDNIDPNSNQAQQAQQYQRNPELTVHQGPQQHNSGRATPNSPVDFQPAIHRNLASEAQRAQHQVPTTGQLNTGQSVFKKVRQSVALEERLPLISTLREQVEPSEPKARPELIEYDFDDNLSGITTADRALVRRTSRSIEKRLKTTLEQEAQAYVKRQEDQDPEASQRHREKFPSARTELATRDLDWLTNIVSEAHEKRNFNRQPLVRLYRPMLMKGYAAKSTHDNGYPGEDAQTQAFQEVRGNKKLVEIALNGRSAAGDYITYKVHNSGAANMDQAPFFTMQVSRSNIVAIVGTWDYASDNVLGTPNAASPTELIRYVWDYAVRESEGSLRHDQLDHLIVANIKDTRTEVGLNKLVDADFGTSDNPEFAQWIDGNVQMFTIARHTSNEQLKGIAAEVLIERIGGGQGRVTLKLYNSDKIVEIDGKESLVPGFGFRDIREVVVVRGEEASYIILSLMPPIPESFRPEAIKLEK